MPNPAAADQAPDERLTARQAGAAACSPGLTPARAVFGLTLLLAVHVGLALAWPKLTGGHLGFAMNLGWFVANLFMISALVLGRPTRLRSGLVDRHALVLGWHGQAEPNSAELAHATRRLRGDGPLAPGVPRRPSGLRGWIAAGVGYAAIVWLLWPLIRVLDENLLLLVLAVMIYGGLLRHPFLVGYLFLFLVCQRFLSAYLYPAFLLGCLLYTTLPPFLRAWREQRQWFLPVCHLAGLVLLTGLLLPIAFYCLQGSSQDLHRDLRDPEVLSALAVSFRTSMLATLAVLAMGVPLAYALVRVPFPGRPLIDTLIDLPIVVPPPIAGITLLAFTGPRSPLGAWLAAQWNVRLFDSEGGIMLAQAFVSSPFLIRAAMIAFGAVDVRYENVARTLGARPISAFFRITLPLALPGILIGMMLTWFRAIAEFGSLRIVANRPRTMPILAYEQFIGYGQAEAHSIGVLVLLMCFSVIIGMWIVRALPTVVRRSVEAIDAAR